MQYFEIVFTCLGLAVVSTCILHATKELYDKIKNKKDNDIFNNM